MTALIDSDASTATTLNADQQRIFSQLRVVTQFVTSVCNARCETCFYWMHLNDPELNNLSLDEITKIARTMPNFPHLLVSGGEPVMRKELPEIVSIWKRECDIQTLDMPTNGLLTKRIVEVVERVLDDHPDVLITVGHSLDGFKETHDRLRGVPNNFEKLFQTFEALTELRARREEMSRQGKCRPPLLRLLTLTCINNQNIDEVERLADWITNKYEVDGVMFECLRGTPKDPDLMPPTPEQFDRIVRKSMEVNDLVLRRRFPEQRAQRLAYIRSVYRLQRSHITTGKIPATCQAGNKLAVLEPDGRVRLCELLDEVGDLRKSDYDFKRVWFGEEANRQRNWIADCRCSCTHCVNMGHSINQEPAVDRQFRMDQFMFGRT